MYEMTPMQWLKHSICHPVEGFEDLRWKKQGSMKIAMVIVVLLFVAMVANARLKGFHFLTGYSKIFNVVPLLVQSVVYFFTWVIGNWAVCTLFDGEGTLKKICIYSAYALVPFIIGMFLSTFLSNFLILEEKIWLDALTYIGAGWSIILMISAMKAAHQYSFSKTLLSMVGTIIAMLLILFLAVLILTLFQQLYIFIYSIYTEVAYRVRG